MVKSRSKRWEGHVPGIGENKNAYRLLVGKPEGRRQLGRLRRRWIVKSKMDLGEIGWNGVYSIVLELMGAFVNTVMNLQVS
jgi:hypothetical protein